MSKSIGFTCKEDAGTLGGGTFYYYPCIDTYESSPNSTETNREIAFNSAGTLSKFLVYIGASGTGVSLTVRKNNADTALTVSPGSSSGLFEDTTNTVSVAAGDKISVKVVTTTGPTINQISLVFDATTNTNQVLGIANSTLSTASVTRYHVIAGVTAGNGSTTEGNVTYDAPKAGTLKRLACRVSANSRSGSATTIKTRKNAADGGMSLTIGTSATGVFEDTSNTMSVSAGDDLCYASVTGTGTQTLTYQYISSQFETTTGDFPVIAGLTAGEGLPASLNSEHMIAGRVTEPSSPGAQHRIKIREACTLSHLSIHLITHSGGSGSLVNRIRIDNADGNMAVSAAANTTGIFTDTSNTDTLTGSEVLSTRTSTLASSTTTMSLIAFNINAGAATTPVSETSIHKYDLLANATQTSIHKYNLAAYIAQTNIHKYHLLNFIAQTSIHKYNLLQNILQSSIHKYNLAAYIAHTSIHKYSLIQNILRAHIHKYDILNTVPSATSVHKYDIRANVVQTSIHKYNLFKDILQTSIHKYNLLQFIAQTNIHKYNLAAYIAQQSIQKYNIIAYVLQNSIHKYNMDGLVAALSIHKYNILNTIAQTSKHKYDILNTIAQSSIHKYDLLNNVLQSSIHKYNLFENVLQSSIQKYNLFAYALQTSIHKYHLFANVLQTSLHKYDIQVLGAVVNALIAKYNISAYIAQTSKHKYDLLNNIAQTSIHKYNLLVNLIANSTQKYDVLQNIVQTSIHKYTLLQNVVLSSIHKYDILVEAATVLANSIHKYHLLNTIVQSSKHKYDLFNTVTRTSIHKYNLLQQILQTSIHKYGMGGIISSQSKHLYNIIREILGSSVAGGVAGKLRPRIIRYPVYRVEELRKLELRRRLKGTQAVVIPAFSENIHRTIAPFVVTNPITNTVKVRFAVRRPEPVSFDGRTPVPVSIPAKTVKNAAHKAKSGHVMQQKTIEKYGKRLNKLSKIMTLFFLHKQLKDD